MPDSCHSQIPAVGRSRPVKRSCSDVARWIKSWLLQLSVERGPDRAPLFELPRVYPPRRAPLDGDRVFLAKVERYCGRRQTHPEEIDYPPDMQECATLLVLKQVEVLSAAGRHERLHR